jgi:hypothetical protein
MKRKHLTKTPVCPRERLVIISYTTGLSFALERIGPLAAITIIVFYSIALYLFALPNTPENQFASIYSESLIKTTCQHLLLLVGFDTLIYWKYYDTPPILVGHQETPRGRWMSTTVSFLSVMKQRFNGPAGERNHFWMLLLADFGDGARKSLVRSFGASSNVEPANNTIKLLCPNLQWGCQSHWFADNKGLDI